MNLKVIGLTRPGLESAHFRFPDHPKWEIGTLLFKPSHLVIGLTRPGFEPTISRTQDQCTIGSATASGPHMTMYAS